MRSPPQGGNSRPPTTGAPKAAGAGQVLRWRPFAFSGVDRHRRGILIGNGIPRITACSMVPSARDHAPMGVSRDGVLHGRPPTPSSAVLLGWRRYKAVGRFWDCGKVPGTIITPGLSRPGLVSATSEGDAATARKVGLLRGRSQRKATVITLDGALAQRPSRRHLALNSPAVSILPSAPADLSDGRRHICRRRRP